MIRGIKHLIKNEEDDYSISRKGVEKNIKRKLRYYDKNIDRIIINISE